MHTGLRHTLPSRLLVLAVIGVLVAAGVWALRARGEQRRREPGGAGTTLAAAIVEVEAGHKSTPLIGEPAAGDYATVTFLAKSAEGKVPRVVSDVTGWGESPDGTFDFNAGTMRRVGGTDWYSLDAKVAPRARIEYLIAYGQTDYRHDPHNPRRTAGPQLAGLPASEFVMPGYRLPQEFAGPAASPAGALREATIESRVFRESRRVIVYTPPGYRDDGDYPVAVFTGQGTRQFPRVLDSLIARHAIEPIVVVFVEWHGDPARTRQFLTDELLRWLASRFRAGRTAGKRAVIGASFGARDALDAAISSPNKYDRLGLVIPGRRIGGAEIDAIAAPRTNRLRVAILAGQYDRSNVPTARLVRQALTDAGDTVDYTEVPEGHSAVTLHHHLRVVLVSLFGTPGG